MKKLIFVIFTGITIASTAQQLPLYSQYMMNAFLLNPAIAGSVDYFPVRLTARQQWVGINDAPSTQALSAHYLFEYQKLGVGGYIFNDQFGPMSRIGIQACASYHIPLSGISSKLGIGLALKGFQFKFDESKLKAIDDADPALSYSTITKFVPDADFGLYLYNDKYFVGVSATQLIELNIDFGDSSVDKNSIIRHYYAMGGYKFTLSDDFDLEPSLLFKGTLQTPWQLDFNVKGYYKRMYWLGVSYRSSKDIVAMLGIKIKKYYLGYAFDYTMSNIKRYTSGSHEILLGINITEGKNRGSKLL
ncbi:MAG TPA: type IX secretion system membrane protein PorP/SprF [Bacteroidales bacterium]|jgi:type IX secretion system PorP/SprF family membrane protein|nr:type IX secretion system membrane protein PorP/SprF [Bacteroidales bacterium]